MIRSTRAIGCRAASRAAAKAAPWTFVIALAGLCLAAPLSAQGEANTLVPSGRIVHAAGPLPDRVVLMPGSDASVSAAVAWRTEAATIRTAAQIAIAGDGPGFADTALTVEGSSTVLVTDNGRALHHRVDFGALRPDTLYAYRVRGHATWSEWFQFRTAPARFEPFTFIYLGDSQNRIRSQVSRVMRQAWLDAPTARLMVHAGDLVNTRDGIDDDEWGEWFHAGGPMLAMTPNLPAAGNHEYDKRDDDSYDALSPHWAAQFPVPRNGLDALAATTYTVDMMGVRFVVLDSTAALELGQVETQTAWLAKVLVQGDPLWTVVIHHHPMMSVTAGRDNAPLREHWQPLFEKHGVDLVLQGHDHAYGRGEVPGPSGSSHGTVYVVSVAGPKQYLLSDRARAAMSRVGEDTQLYQLVHVDRDRLRYESKTATGARYDAFDLVRRRDGGVRLVEHPEGRLPERRCADPQTTERCRTR
jgi:hypothetical protein